MDIGKSVRYYENYGKPDAYVSNCTDNWRCFHCDELKERFDEATACAGDVLEFVLYKNGEPSADDMERWRKTVPNLASIIEEYLFNGSTVSDMQSFIEDESLMLPLSKNGKPVHVGDIMSYDDGTRFKVIAIDDRGNLYYDIDGGSIPTSVTDASFCSLTPCDAI